MGTMVLVWIAKIALVVALLGAAAAIATPPGRLPLALRGLGKMLGRDRTQPPAVADGLKLPSATKRFVAFVLIILALLVAVL